MPSLTDRLPDEIFVPIKKRDVILPVTIMMVGIILINISLIMYLDRYPNEFGVIILKTRLQKLLADDYSWLILGDSSGRHGLNDSLFVAEGMGSTYNASTFGEMTPIYSVWFLNAYLEEHPAPEGVIIAHANDVFLRDINEKISSFAWTPLPFGFWKNYTPEIKLDLGATYRIFSARYLPLLSRPRETKMAIRYPDKYLFKKQLEYYNHEYGFMPRDADMERVDRDRIKQKNRIIEHNNNFSFSETSLLTFSHLNELGEKHNFTIYYCLVPVDEIVVTDKIFRGFYNQFVSQLKDVTDKYPNIKLISDKMYPVAKENLESFRHVTESVANEFTLEQIELLKEDIQSNN
ncbi:hypothetical protein K8I28_11665 [bacterium]|nr:hypothetical protein [bacterium]